MRHFCTSTIEQPTLVGGGIAIPLPRLDGIKPTTSLRDLAASVVATAAEELAARETSLRVAGDAEVVHRARVEIRRLRARLRALRPVLDRGWVAEINADTKWLSDALGKVRDADILTV